MNSPFDYPLTPHVRRHGPAGYADYQSFKPWLRDEFTFRCVFCLLRERWCPPFGADVFSVEHLTPRSVAPELELVFDNLLYACVACNSSKSDRTALLDPTQTGYGTHITILPDGSAKATTEVGIELINAVHLNRPELVRYRREMLEFAQVASDNPQSAIAERFQAMMKFPDELPDLASLRPPGGNARPDGVHDCAFARRQRGELPDTY